MQYLEIFGDYIILGQVGDRCFPSPKTITYEGLKMRVRGQSCYGTLTLSVKFNDASADMQLIEEYWPEKRQEVETAIVKGFKEHFKIA